MKSSNSIRDTRRLPATLITLLLLSLAASAFRAGAQELEPRRWSHLPTGSHFAGLGYAYTSGDILFDPVLRLDDVELSLHSSVFKYVGTFELFERSARIDLLQGYQEAEWQGLVNGVPASAARDGWTDTVLRFSMNLLGAPPLQGKEFADYRKSVAGGETIVGAGVAVHLPTGHYLDDKLLNLGSNRFTVRPQLGVVHNRGKWSFEATGSAWIFTENDDFFGGNRLEQDPLYTLQGHVAYTFRPGLWVSTGFGCGLGAESTLNGIGTDDRKGNLAWGVSLGIPISKQVGLKIGYLGMRTQERVGADLDTFAAGISFLW